MRILIVSGDAEMASFLGRLLQATGAEIERKTPGQIPSDTLCAGNPDLLVLDAETDGERALDRLSALREAVPLCAVLVLSGRASPALRARWLDCGADDCLSKPFSLGELRARCGALLRRQRATEAVLSMHGGGGDAAEGSSLRLSGLEFNRLRRQVTCDGTAVRLTEREAGLLEQLMLAAGTVVPRHRLLERFGEPGPVSTEKRTVVWNPAATGSCMGANVVDVHVAAVRRKLQGCPGAPAIETVRGAGYRITAAAPPLPAAVCKAAAPDRQPAAACVWR
jgi:DNA-binding response OmpR family regulator